jgi:hypothetical protein
MAVIINSAYPASNSGSAGKAHEWSKLKVKGSILSCGLYYKRVTIVIDAPSVVKVTLQIVASLTIITRL